MGDMTEMIWHMPVAPDADGRDQLVNDGGVVTLLIQGTTDTEVVFDKDETLPNHENSANPVIKYVLQWVKDYISLVANKWTRISDHKKNMRSNPIEGDIGHFDNKIDMSVRKSSDDTKVDDIRLRVGHFVSPDDPGVNVLASGRLPTGNFTNWDRTTNNASDGNSGYHVNEIEMAHFESLGDTKVGIMMSQGRRSVLPESFEMLGVFNGVLQKY